MEIDQRKELITFKGRGSGSYGSVDAILFNRDFYCNCLLAIPDSHRSNHGLANSNRNISFIISNENLNCRMKCSDQYLNRIQIRIWYGLRTFVLQVLRTE